MNKLITLLILLTACSAFGVLALLTPVLNSTTEGDYKTFEQ